MLAIGGGRATADYDKLPLSNAVEESLVYCLGPDEVGQFVKIGTVRPFQSDRVL